MTATKASKKLLIIGLVLLIVLGIAGMGTVIALRADASGRQELKDLIIKDVDFTHLRDGTFIGQYIGTQGSSRNTMVEVSIYSGNITKITILKGAIDSKGNSVELTNGETINDLFQKVLESKSLQVDAISGATLTSKAHLKALENALKQAEQ